MSGNCIEGGEDVWRLYVCREGWGVFGACIEGGEYVWRLYVCKERGCLETVWREGRCLETVWREGEMSGDCIEGEMFGDHM